MIPSFHLPLLGQFHTNTFIIGLCFVFALFLFYLYCRNFLSFWKIIITLTTTSWLAFIGARLFHVAFERPEYFRQHPDLIFAQFDGMTFYGAFFVGGAVLYMFTQIWQIRRAERLIIWDLTSLITALTYFFMRVGCFANGCCWGKISSVPWAVQYFNSEAVMPYLGIPVHPVQLYDAAHGLLMFLVLMLLRRFQWLTGSHVFVVFVLYPVGRFFTEFYRGDSFRGEDIFLGLSTSQLISFFVFAAGLVGLYRARFLRVDVD